MTPADKPDLPECTCAAKDMPFGRCCKAMPVEKPIAVVGSVYTLHWAGAGPIAPIVERYGIKVGDGLYCAMQVQQLLADERRKALTEAIEAVEDTDEATVHGSQGYYCQLGDARQQRRDCADAIRALIDRKEPTK